MKKLREIKSLSISQMGKYERCPRLWYEQYVLGNWYSEPSQALSFGIAFHVGMEKMMAEWGNNSCLTNTQSAFEYEYHFGRHPGTDLDVWIPKGNTMLASMLDRLSSMNFEPVEIEKSCTRKNFKGRADCLARVDGELVLIDWKTTSREFKKRRVEEDEQLTAYGWMMPNEWTMMAFGVANKRTLEAYWYPTWRSPEQISEFAVKVKHIRAELETRQKFIGEYTRQACMAYNRKCDLWLGNFCRGLDDF